MELNQDQYQAVLHTTGSAVVCAGAGSGKTRVIAQRVLHLIHIGVLPEAIMCITFTNKAAKEMRERIFALLEGYPTLPLVNTFHGFALWLIRRYGKHLGITDCIVLGEDQQESIIKNIFKILDIKDKAFTVKKVLSSISVIKNNYFQKIDGPPDLDNSLFQQVYLLYEQEKQKNKLFDFDDLLILAIKLLSQESILYELRKIIRHIMIDEYQDTNHIQHLIVKKIAQDDKQKFLLDSLFVVGDEDQSIYSWRGANVQNILSFKKDFPDATYYKLTQNYRSSQSILGLANTLIAKNSIRNHKELWSTKDTIKKTIVLECQTGYHESEIIVNTIKMLRNKNQKYSSAILYRSHYQSRLFEEICIKYNVPYKIYGGINFYQREEVKDILSYLYLSVNQYDQHSFLRCCNVPNRGFGEITKEAFIAYWNMTNGTVINTIDNYLQEKKVAIKMKLALTEILDVINHITTLSNPADAIIYVINKIGYHAYLEKHAETKLEYESRKENLEELVIAAKTFFEEQGGSVADFVSYLSVLYEKSEYKDSTNNPLLLMSIHAAKGLEFNIVAIVGLEAGSFPSNRSHAQQESLEEERRLLYVAVTRAKDILLCSHAATRVQWGGTQIQTPSCFLHDFDARYCYFLTYKKHTHIDMILQKYLIQDEEINNIQYTNPYAKDPHIPQEVVHPYFGKGKVIKDIGNYYIINFNGSLKTIDKNFFK
jgi:DNA helicase-2/ATP-dependent DNA helicase PcrA